METKEAKPISGKSSDSKSLKEKLILAVNKVLYANKSEMSDKIQKVINKSIKEIVKKSNKQIKKALKSK